MYKRINLNSINFLQKRGPHETISRNQKNLPQISHFCLSSLQKPRASGSFDKQLEGCRSLKVESKKRTNHIAKFIKRKTSECKNVIFTNKFLHSLMPISFLLKMLSLCCSPLQFYTEKYSFKLNLRLEKKTPLDFGDWFESEVLLALNRCTCCNLNVTQTYYISFNREFNLL